MQVLSAFLVFTFFGIHSHQVSIDTIDYYTSMRLSVDDARLDEDVNKKEYIQLCQKLYERNIALAKSPQEEPLIPKVIHQIWSGPKTPPAVFAKSQQSLKKLHPNWEYRLWTDKDVKNLTLLNREFFDKSSNYGEKSDILRYEILYQFGGVYLDVDFVALKPLDILHHSFDFYGGLLPWQKSISHLANGIIGSAKGHPILEECIQSLPHSWANATKGEMWRRILKRSGPIHFQNVFAKIVKKTPKKAIALPRNFFFPIDIQQAKAIRKGKVPLERFLAHETFAAHYYTGSWIGAKVKK